MKYIKYKALVDIGEDVLVYSQYLLDQTTNFLSWRGYLQTRREHSKNSTFLTRVPRTNSKM